MSRNTCGCVYDLRAVGSATSRVTSIDIFRGLTMLVMIFVNDLGEVQRLARGGPITRMRSRT